jgi:hypothetical protein
MPPKSELPQREICVAMTAPRRPWVKLQLPDGAGRQEWADLLSDLDAWLRHRGDGTTIYDVQPLKDDAATPYERRGGTDRRSD